MLILTQSILQLLSLMLLRQASENAMSVPLWVKEADTGTGFCFHLDLLKQAVERQVNLFQFLAIHGARRLKRTP